MADTKKYLDLHGLGTLVTNIKAADKANADAIDALKALHIEGKTVAQEAADAAASVKASSAAEADHAAAADSATKATQDGAGNVITATYATKTELANIAVIDDDTINGLFA